MEADQRQKACRRAEEARQRRTGEKFPGYAKRPVRLWATRERIAKEVNDCKKMHRIIIHFKCVALSLVSAFAFPSGGHCQNSQIPEVAALNLQLEIHQEKVKQPLLDLQAKYDGALEKLGKDAQRRGDLDAVLEIERERDQFRKRDALEKKANDSALARMQEIYQTEARLLSVKIAAGQLKVLNWYADELESVVEDFTKKGEIDKAVEIRKLVDLQRERIAKADAGEKVPDQGKTDSPQGTGGREILVLGSRGKYETAGMLPIKVDRAGRLFTLSSQGNATSVRSNEDLVTPFRVLARAKTDSTEIRLYFGNKGAVIFNRAEGNRKSHFADPETGKWQEFQSGAMGQLTVDQMYDLEIRVSENVIRVFIDGELLGEVSGDFRSVSGRIGIGPALGSTVTVEYLKGIQELVQ
ncbi:MAG: hypothetical protein KDN20_11360 [Verrucomicrobiae bacterium]|nr:hypothetical protein [Verrucomicrobiae bacterium]